MILACTCTVQLHSHTRCKTVRKKNSLISILILDGLKYFQEDISFNQPTIQSKEKNPFEKKYLVEKSASKMSPKNVKNFGCRCCLLFLCFSFEKKEKKNPTRAFKTVEFEDVLSEHCHIFFIEFPVFFVVARSPHGTHEGPFKKRGSL